MCMDTKVLSDLLQFGERIHVEAKLAKNEVPKALWETYSSRCFRNPRIGNFTKTLQRCWSK